MTKEIAKKPAMNPFPRTALPGKKSGRRFIHTAGAVSLCTIILLVLSAGCLGTSAATLPASVGTAPYPRIICLSSDAAELLVIIGAGDHVTGVPDSLIRHQPELYRLLPNAQSIGDAKKPDNEKIITLRPDIILFISAMRPSTADKWEAAGIRVLPLECHKAEDLPAAARMLGHLTGHTEQARQYAAFCEKILALVSSRIGQDPASRQRIYFESYTDYVAYGNISAADSLTGLLKAESITGLVFFNATRVSSEWITDQDPEIIIKSVIPDDTKTLEGEHTRMLERTGFSKLRAVKTGRVYVISGNLLFSPHAPVGTLFLAKALYPEKFADVQPESVLKEYADTYLPGTDQQPAMYPVPWE